MSYTRLELFRGIADQLGERIQVTATTASGSALQFVSSDKLTMPENALKGREVWYSSAQPASAANQQTSRRVVANGPSTTSITVDAAWPATPQLGDVIDLVNPHSNSVRIAEIHDKINAIIDEVADEFATEVAGSSVTFDALSPSLSYPATWDWIIACQWQDRNDVWHPIFKQDLEFMPWDSVVVVKNKPRRMLTSYPVRLIGQIRLSPLDDDADTTTVPKSWLVMRAAKELKRGAGMRRQEANTDLTVSNMYGADDLMLRAQATRQSYGGRGSFRWSTR